MGKIILQEANLDEVISYYTKDFSAKTLEYYIDTTKNKIIFKMFEEEELNSIESVF